MSAMSQQETSMGAVRVPVKLTNTIDQVLVERGLLAPHLLREVEAQGLVDTGALTLVIPPEIVQQLGLKIRSQQVAQFANGAQELVGVTEAITIRCKD